MGSKELEELKDIKKLLMLSLIINGANSEDLASVLGTDGSTIRRMIPMKKLKKLQSQIK